MEKPKYNMQTATLLKDNGLLTKQMDSEFTSTKMEGLMRDFGLTIPKMDMDSKNGEMAVAMKDNLMQA